MPKSKLKLSVGIPAFNESAAIKTILSSLLQQKQIDYDLIEIIVVSDGSYDNTVEEARSIQNPLIHVVDSKERLGKNKRVNQIFDSAQGDVIAVIDADVVPTSPLTLNYLIQPFLTDTKMAYVSGYPIPTKPVTFIEKAAFVTRNVWDEMRDVLDKGNGFYAFHGQLFALSKNFAKLHPFPSELWTDCGYHYFMCKKEGLNLKAVKDASVYIRIPSTVHDQLAQLKRYKKEDKTLSDYFGQNITAEYQIPKIILWKYKLKTFIKYPIHCLVIFGLNFVGNHILGKNKKVAKADWEMIASTKKPIKYDY